MAAAILKIKTNYDCDIYIDGVFIATAYAKHINRFNIECLGTYIIEAKIKLGQYTSSKSSITNELEISHKDYEYLTNLRFTEEMILESYFSFLQDALKQIDLAKNSPIVSLATLQTLKNNIKGAKVETLASYFQLHKTYLNIINDIDEKIRITKQQFSNNEVLNLNCSLIEYQYEDEFEGYCSNARIILPDNSSFIDLEYEFYKDFEYGFAIIGKDGKYGIIDKIGNLILPCEYGYIDFIFCNDDSWDYLYGIIKDSEYDIAIQYYFTIYNYPCEDFHIKVHKDMRCVYDENEQILITYPRNIDEIKDDYDLNIIDNTGEYWNIPSNWSAITKVSYNGDVIFYDPEEGYGIARMDYREHKFGKPIISACEEINYIGGDYYAIKRKESRHIVSDIERLYIDGIIGVSEEYWKFSETATIFNSDLFNIYEGFIFDFEMKGNGIPCEIHYLNGRPDPYSDLDIHDCIVVKGEIKQSDFYPYNNEFHKTAYGWAGRGHNVDQLMNSYYIDWNFFIELDN